VQFPRTLLVAVLLVCPAASALAQTPTSVPDTASRTSDLAPLQGRSWLTPDRLPLAPQPAPRTPNPFTSYGSDMKRFFSSDTAKFMSVAGLFAVAALPFDTEGIEESQEHWGGSSAGFKAGNIGGGFLVQAGAAAGTFAIGKAIGSDKTASVGADLLRAQLVSQTVVQGIKFATQRTRPDGSNNHSFPSGHTASAFAMAGVLERHFGWKVGIPAYGFATYVGAARMQANKHHLSDVMMGAALGIAAARVVTMDVGGTKFDLGVAPTHGGAAVTFTKR
jgi:hypothetical protein